MFWGDSKIFTLLFSYYINGYANELLNERSGAPAQALALALW